MPKISQFKVVASLPATLEPDAVYYVRVGTGFDIYVTNSSGTVVAYPSNQVNPPTVTLPEAQAGAETALRSWPPQRVRQAIAALSPAGNRIINGGFVVNQRAVSGTVVLAPANYGHDRWRAGSSGCTYVASTSGGVTTLTITAGSLQQVIEGASLQSGTHVLSWVGTALGRIGTGSYSSSGVTASVVGGSDLTIEFGTGTLALVQFEPGAVPSTFEHRPYGAEFDLCQRYTRRMGRGLIGQADTASSVLLALTLQPPMRTAPTFLGIGGSGVSGILRVGGAVQDYSGFGTPSLTNTGGYIVLIGSFVAGERYIAMSNMALLSAEL
ncbi:hypothetical protein [Metapseudomonas otitidis]|uniref:hypothetical protein n=1 Tax=Metapseudomonas otitidis TaxID=319939 RepID=UPI001F3E40E7|nr:hypothetical protein [Pseudomonas otitidis]